MAEKTKAELEEELEGVKTQLADSRKEGERLQQENAELNEELTRLIEQLEQVATEQKVGRPVITVGKKRYQVNSRVIILAGQRYTPEDLKEHPDVVAQLLKRKSGALTEIGD